LKLDNINRLFINEELLDLNDDYDDDDDDELYQCVENV